MHSDIGFRLPEQFRGFCERIDRYQATEAESRGVTTGYDRIHPNYDSGYDRISVLERLGIQIRAISDDELRQSPTSIDRGIPVGDCSGRDGREWWSCSNSENGVSDGGR